MAQNNTGSTGSTQGGSSGNTKGATQGHTSTTATGNAANQNNKQGDKQPGQQSGQNAGHERSGTKPTTPNPMNAPGRDDQTSKPAKSTSPAALPGREVEPTTPSETSNDGKKAYGPGGGHVVNDADIDDDSMPEIITPQGGTDGIKGAGSSQGKRTGPGADTKPL